MSVVSVHKQNGRLFFHRLTLNQRIQHIVIFTTFTLLALTGLPLKFHHTAWGTFLYSLVGGITYGPIIHRVSASIMTVGFVYHFLYVIVCAWRYYLQPLRRQNALTLKSGIIALCQMPMVPTLTDLRELHAARKYFFFLTSERPALLQHGLKEKFGYFAVFWGVPIIGISGFLLWGETYSTQYVSGRVLNFAYIAHSDEALLASIVIFIWHLYNVHFSPACFPMGRAWINGMISDREMVQYHYRDYVAAMQNAGLEGEIRPNRYDAALRTSFISRLIEKIYLALMAIGVIVATVLIVRVIYESVFVLGYQVVTTEPVAIEEPLVEPHLIDEIKLDTSDNRTLFRGYRFVREAATSDHYHRIVMNVQPDTVSHCISCHGDLPHGTSEKTRAFLNMHNLYFACQVCHMRTRPDGAAPVYFWADRGSGKPVDAPELGTTPIDQLGIKLTPCETCDTDPDPGRIVREQDSYRALITRLRNSATSRADKQEMVKSIHRNVSDKPIACAECHNRDDPYLPLERIGYPSIRAKLVSSDQITKLINEYKEFYAPVSLRPAK